MIQKPSKRIDMRLIIPNIITLAALCSGVSAIKFAFAGEMGLAVVAILVSALLDGMDGHIARAIKGTSSFGAELDSLADLVNFGVAPALILYIWNLHHIKNFGWFACMIFIIAIALRLARFNVHNNLTPPEEPTLVKPQAYFLGVPAPASALLSLFPIYLDLTGYITYLPSAFLLSCFYVLFVAAMAVSTLKTFSFKAIRFGVRNVIIILFGIASFAAMLVTFTWHTLIILCLCYWIHIGFSIYRLTHKKNISDN